MTRVPVRAGRLARRRLRTVARRNWAYLALLVCVVLPLLWMAAALAIRSGLFGFSGVSDPHQVEVFLTFIAGGLGTAATVLGALLTHEHNRRERRRLRLETVIRSLESLPADARRPRLAGVVSTMVLLGQQRIAIRVLEPAWDTGDVDDGTATWLIGQVLTGAPGAGDDTEGDRTDESAINEAAALLANRARQGRLTDDDSGRYYFPGHFVRQWETSGPLPDRAKDNLLLAMGHMLASRGRDWWCPAGDLPQWPTEILVECAEHEPNPAIRSSAAVLIAALYECFPDRFTDHLAPTRLAAILDRAHAAGSTVPLEYVQLAARIRTGWSHPGGRAGAPATVPAGTQAEN